MVIWLGDGDRDVVFVELDVDFLKCKVFDVSGMKVDFIILLYHFTIYDHSWSTLPY